MFVTPQILKNTLLNLNHLFLVTIRIYFCKKESMSIITDKGVPVNLKTSTCMFTYTIWLNKEKSAVKEKSLGSKKIVGNRRETHGSPRFGAKTKIGPPKN